VLRLRRWMMSSSAWRAAVDRTNTPGRPDCRVARGNLGRSSAELHMSAWATLRAGAGWVVVMGAPRHSQPSCVFVGATLGCRGARCRCLAQSHHHTKPGTRTAPARSRSRTCGLGRHSIMMHPGALHLGYRLTRAAVRWHQAHTDPT
jgi:hypothetical protein